MSDRAADQTEDERERPDEGAAAPEAGAEAAERERDEYLELAQRTRADFDNYRKRVANEAAAAFERGKGELARELVPVLDNLDRALEAASSSAAAESEADSLAKGVGLVRDELRSVLERAGVEAYDPAGERFDPSWHEAVSTRADEGAEAGTVLETLERGYRLDGQVLRAARVVVSE
ncbi:MAG: nucleotide exchange factor GrpE [Solirubrobacterales bacterium]